MLTSSDDFCVATPDGTYHNGENGCGLRTKDGELKEQSLSIETICQYVMILILKSYIELYERVFEHFTLLVFLCG